MKIDILNHKMVHNSETARGIKKLFMIKTLDSKNICNFFYENVLSQSNISEVTGSLNSILILNCSFNYKTAGTAKTVRNIEIIQIIKIVEQNFR